MSVRKNIYGIDHINLQCQTLEEFDKVIDFYKNLLGFEEIRHWQNGEKKIYLLDAKGTNIEIAYVNQPKLQKGVITHLALNIKNIEEVFKGLTESGVEVIQEIKDVEIKSERPVRVRLAFLKGFAGEEIELFETL